MAALTGIAVGENWRWAYLVGLIPALLVFSVRSQLTEPPRRSPASSPAVQGNLFELLRPSIWSGRAILGLLLAAVGLGTFWGVIVAGQDLAYEMQIRAGVQPHVATQHAKFAYGILQTLGGGLGLLSFGPLAERIGRRGAFLVMHILACLIVPITCYLPSTYNQLLILLPLFGFCTLSIHAGYAIYFPELFPDHLRATGVGFCFNGGRLLAAPILLLSGQWKADFGLQPAVTMLSGLFLLGLILLVFLPETKGQPLPQSIDDPTTVRS
jgi:MFS family permease